MNAKHANTKFVRTIYIALVVAVALLVTAFSAITPRQTDGDARIWIAAFTYDVPAGTWSLGTHTYHFEFNLPEPGSSNDATFTVSNDAPLYNGFVLLRPLIYGIEARLGNECANVDAVNPEQPTRFLAGFLTDTPVNYQEAQAFFQDFRATVLWDDGNSAALVQHEVRPYFDSLWPGYVCTYTAPR